MKFVLAQTPRYWWPVKVRIPDPANAGKVLEQVLKIQFEPLDLAASVQLNADYMKLPTAEERAKHEHDQLRMVCKNWDDVEGENGSPLAFSEANFEAALQQSWFRIGVYKAYSESLSGEEYKLGN